MKSLKLAIALLATPIFLTACNTFGDPFGPGPGPDNDYRYRKYDTNVVHTPAHGKAAKSKGQEDTKMMQPGESNVKTPKHVSKAEAATTTHKSPAHDGPAVPNKAPVVGQ